MSKQIDIILILDESGSMQSMGNEPVEAVNSFIEEQQALKDNSTFTLYTFSSKVRVKINDKPLCDISPLKYEDYRPSNTTALYDAIGQAIDAKRESANNKNVIMVILTDGYENSSTDYNRNQIKNMITEMEKSYDWKFIYLGANQDVFAVGDGIGVNHKTCGYFECTPTGLATACKMASSSIAKYKTSLSDDNTVDLDLTT